MPRPSSAQHGTTSRYTGGCRCDDCRAAQQRYVAEYRARQIAKRGYVADHTGVELKFAKHPSDVLLATRPNTSATTDEVPMGRKDRVAALKDLNALIVEKAMAPKPPTQAPRSAPRYQVPQKPPPRIDEDGMVHEEAGWD